MSPIKGWLLGCLTTLVVGFFGFLMHEAGTDWTSIPVPLPPPDSPPGFIYLADFSYLGLLAVTAYWLTIARFALPSPEIRSPAGILLAIAVVLFLIVSLDIVSVTIPTTEQCQNESFGNGISVAVCKIGHEPRLRIACAALAAMVSSVIVLAISKARQPIDKQQDPR